MEPKKSKPVTTSVSSISIKYNANIEKIEEVHYSDEDCCEDKKDLGNLQPVSNPSDQDSSPLKLFPKILVKRSTSVDQSADQNFSSSSPPSDPWRFFSDIKGKITKSVEEKITEIKARHEEGSPIHKSKITDSKSNKTELNKENSSFSDSEDQSESSISKTCGFASTTEGVEMSSDDEISSIDKEKKLQSSTNIISQKFKFLKHGQSNTKEGTIKINNLAKLYNINTEKIEQALPEYSDEVESGVDALEETEFKRESPEKITMKEDIIKKVTDKIDNIEVDEDNTVKINEISGEKVSENFKLNKKSSIVFAPMGFVDMRRFTSGSVPPNDINIFPYVFLSIYIVAYAIFHTYLPYMAGLLLGVSLALSLSYIYMKLYTIPLTIPPQNINEFKQKIMEIPAIKEHQPISKYEGWVNEYPDLYDPVSYHISFTQSVYLRLQGNLLRISHSKSKVPKRAMWNEPETNKPTFNHHRIYNLLGAKITLLPERLTKVRLWSKKYPICITLNKDQMNFDATSVKEEFDDFSAETENKTAVTTPKTKKKFTFKRKDYGHMAQRFSKLSENQDVDLDSDSRASTPSPEDLTNDTVAASQNSDEKLNIDDDMHSLPDESLLESLQNEETKIYIFGRTDREKENWFRVLAAATHYSGEKNTDEIKNNLEYSKYMMLFTNNKALRRGSKQENAEEVLTEGNIWINAFIGRILFDCVRSPDFTKKVQNRIQKKLQTIKLPYFIEEILITELNLGKSPPLITKSEQPQIDNRGLWIDLDISYEGSVVLTLQTKVNLMKLKNPQLNDNKTLNELKSAIYHSDVDDTAESSSDEDGPQEIPLINKEGTSPATTTTTTTINEQRQHGSNKKFIKMVDRITESKFFQAATENRYIKKAMEGVSNTEIRLTVELKALSGTVVLNIPPSPSDRVWVGFRPVPDLILTACPIVGDRNLTYTMVTNWIEKKMLQEFQKVMVIPNMEDFLVPAMTSNLPN